jgi:hypothetical protein
MCYSAGAFSQQALHPSAGVFARASELALAGR